ncbi:MAG: M20/M25/M40 family metallo-hydrolase [Clostridia bacterium]|nr:M20/M25/M40 family metallo-hydrolase [Clostridia bacterium]
MDIKELFAKIDANTKKYTDFLCKICSFEARAYDKEELDRLSDYITEFAEKEGFSVTRTPFEKCGDFLSVEINPDKEKDGIFLAHTDTVHEKGAFGTPSVREDDEKIYAPGAIDCKGGIAIAMLLMKVLKESGYSKNLKLLLTTDEEISNILGGQKEREFFYDSVKGHPFAINCETTQSDEVCISRKGILRYRIDVTGKSGHSGIHYFESKNALAEAAHKIVALESASKKGGTSYSCNIINAGKIANIIPGECSFTIDVRVLTHKAISDAKETVKNIVEKSYIGGTMSTCTLLSERPPMEKTDDTVKLFDELLGITQKYGLGSLTPVASGGGSDSCYTQKAGVPSICGMGASGEFCHTPQEYANKSSIPLRAKIITAFIFEREERSL